MSKVRSQEAWMNSTRDVIVSNMTDLRHLIMEMTLKPPASVGHELIPRPLLLKGEGESTFYTPSFKEGGRGSSYSKEVTSHAHIREEQMFCISFAAHGMTFTIEARRHEPERKNHLRVPLTKQYSNDHSTLFR